MRLFKKGQGATEYLLMLAAVLVIVAIAVCYITTAAPTVTITGEAKVGTGNTITFTPKSMVGTPETIPAADWEYAVYRDATVVKAKTGGPGSLSKGVPISLSTDDAPAIGDVVKLWYKGSSIGDAAKVAA